MWTRSLHVCQNQGTLLAVCTYVMCSSLTAYTNQVLFFNYPNDPLDVETPGKHMDTVAVLFSLPVDGRQTVKSSDEHCLDDLSFSKFGVRESVCLLWSA